MKIEITAKLTRDFNFNNVCWQVYDLWVDCSDHILIRGQYYTLDILTDDLCLSASTLISFITLQ